MPEQTSLPYNRIHKAVDRLITNNGSENTADMLESLAVTKIKNTVEIQDLIFKQIICSFKINKILFETGWGEKYKNARLSCFFLLNKHAGLSPVQIKEKFKKYKQGRTNINNKISEMKNIIELPKANPKLYELHTEVEKVILLFIEKK